MRQIKIVTIIGARPQIIKAAGLSRAIQKHFKNQIKEVIVHTGQHYDANMSQIFFDELGIPKPDYNLKAGSATHGRQTACMIEGIEDILEKETPDGLILYGDTNSTLAGGIAASKIHIPVIHIEAGLRSHNKNMPEEINRILCDHVSTLLFSPTKAGVRNLQKEGFDVNTTPPYSPDKPGIFHCGDIMYDNTLHFKEVAKQSKILKKLNLQGEPFILATIHRPSNTDDTDKLSSICEALLRIADEKKIVWPLHPRTSGKIEKLDKELLNRFRDHSNILLTEPVSFLEMVVLEDNCHLILTDSGGVQKEAYFLNKPCVILREQTEWIELVEQGSAILAGANKDKILAAYNELKSKHLNFPNIFGNGEAGKFICQKLLDNLIIHA